MSNPQADRVGGGKQPGSASHGEHEAAPLETRSRLSMSATMWKSRGSTLMTVRTALSWSQITQQVPRGKTTRHTDTHLGFSSGNGSGSPMSPGHHSWIPIPAAQTSCVHLIERQSFQANPSRNQGTAYLHPRKGRRGQGTSLTFA